MGWRAEQRRSVEEEVSTVKDVVEVSLRVSGSYLLQNLSSGEPLGRQSNSRLPPRTLFSLRRPGRLEWWRDGPLIGCRCPKRALCETDGLRAGPAIRCLRSMPEFLAEPSVKSCFEISFASANEQSLGIPACFCFLPAEGSVVSGSVLRMAMTRPSTVAVV